MFGAPDVIPLWVADMDFAAPPAITRALGERALHPIYGYTLYPDSLYESLMAWLKRRHGWEVRRDWIMMCPGVVPSLHAAVAAFAEPGASVIVQPPVYFPFFSSVTATGRKLVLNPLVLQNGAYAIDFDHLEHCARAGARLLLLCSPHNPVGRVWSSLELDQILEIARKYGLTIFSDEIHADLIYSGHKHHVISMLAQAASGDVPIITAVAPSKTFNIPGLNLSVVIVPDPGRREKLSRMFEAMHVSASNPFSIAAFEAAYREGEQWLEALLPYLADTRDMVSNYLTAHIPQIRLIAPEGTYLLWLDCRALKSELNMNDMQLGHFFVHEAGVGMSPGMLFGEAGSGFMRMNIGAPRKTVETALKNIRNAIQ
jgi:cystathionine beta-lyase